MKEGTHHIHVPISSSLRSHPLISEGELRNATIYPSDPAKQTISIEGPTAPPQLPKGPGLLAGMLDEREVAQHLLQSDDLTRDKLCNNQADDIGDVTHVCGDSSHFVARQAIRLRTETEDDLVAIHDIDIEMDGNTRASRRLEPIEKRLTGEVKIVRTKRSD